MTELEATQRAQALLLLQDMATRIEANRKLAASYVTSSSGSEYNGVPLADASGRRRQVPMGQSARRHEREARHNPHADSSWGGRLHL